MRPVVGVGLFAAAVALSGCAYYSLQDRNAPVATFRFNYAGGASQYSVVGADACEKGERLAKFGAFDSAKKNIRIAADKPVRIKARTPFRDLRPGAPLEWCESVAEFSPKAGRNYRMWHFKPRDSKCVLKVEDVADSAAPPDVVIQDALPCPPFFFSW